MDHTIEKRNKYNALFVKWTSYKINLTDDRNKFALIFKKSCKLLKHDEIICWEKLQMCRKEY